MRKLTQEEFLSRCKKAHGNKYDYSKTKFITITKPITFFCNICKNYTTVTQARHHVEKNRGCDICGNAHPNKQTTEVFIKRFFYRHKSKNYDFSSFEYKGTQVKSTVLCENGHKFSITPNDLLTGYGCRECSKEKATGRPSNKITDIDINTLLNRNIFIRKEDYINSNSKIEAECLICDYKWNVRYISLSNGTGCPECAKKSIRNKLKIPFKEAVNRARDIYGSTYFYVEETYVNMKTPMKIVCYKHGGFFTSIQSHCRTIRPSVCKECHPPTSGFDKQKESILYSIRIGDLYKIGITNRNVDQRYSKSDKNLFSNIIEIPMSGIDAFEKEKDLKNKYSEYKYNGEDILDSGNTELFTIDIFLAEGLFSESSKLEKNILANIIL